MNAVGRLGSYISRGVYTVSGPFHPFGGCVDIIVVEQEDGTFKSSSWYVRFGKFQGVLKAREKVVNICVNGSEAGFHMYLDHKGEAYFLKDVDDDAVAEGKSVLNNSSSSSSSGDDETEGPARPASRDFGGAAGNGKVAARTNSRRAQILGLVFGRRSMKESEGGGESDMKRADSLERAEFAANLLEVKWSTNLDTTNKSMKDDASKLYDRGVLEGQGGRDTRIDGPINREDSSEESCVEETVLEVSCTSALEKSDETSTVSEGVLASESGVASNVTKFADESIASVIEIEEKADGVLSASVDAGLQVSPESGQQFDEGEDEVTDTQGGGELSECSISHKGGTFIYCESSESSIVRKDASSEQTHETLFIASGGSGELRVRSEVLRARTEPLSEDTVVEHLLEDYELEAPPMEGRIDYSEQTDPICSGTGNHNVVFDEAVVELESRTRTNLSNPNLGSVGEVELQDICTVSSYNSLFQQSGEEKSMKAEDSASELQPSSVAVTDCVATEITNMASSVGLEEEQLLFGDIDEFKISKTQSMESNFLVKEGTDNHSEGTEELNGLIDKSDESRSPSEKFFNENQSPDFESLTGKFRVSSSPIAITRAHKVVDEEVGRLTGSLPNMRSQIVNIGAADINCLSHSLDSNSKPLNWTLQNKDNSSPPKLNEDEEHQLVVELPDMNNALVTAEAKDVPSAHAIGDPSNGSMYPSGNWRIWPFSFRRSRSRKAMQSALSEARSSDAENASEVNIGVVEDKKSKPEPKAAKKVVRVLSPTSDQLASLNLKEGRNTVTFTFLTPMLGKQQVDARIYLWKWDTRIVISDVDGTITRSDVLGQFMPLVGVDWSHLGVAHLFSAIKDNGYQMLFLSARAISQAYITRQFLFNLKQDGKALPDGPVVISPDGLFPSLYREVIRRAPHEFKISCLEEIRSLFPSDCNPFYAGFGNRDTDEISYLKVGIPKGKIFIINPKGEVAVNRRVDTKSYKSIHALVNGMFPPAASSEQEDFNSWNFWKLPPPIIDV